MDKQLAVYPHRLLLSNKKKGDPDACNNMGESGKNPCKWKKQDTITVCDFTFMKSVEKAKLDRRKVWKCLSEPGEKQIINCKCTKGNIF